MVISASDRPDSHNIQCMTSASTSVSCIHTPLCEACVILRDVDQEILRMTSALQKLHTRRHEVVTGLNRSHDRVTRIPPEITSHIFYLYTRDETSNIVKGLFTIALVSKTWRNIVLSTPQLWTSITLSAHSRRWTFPCTLAEKWLRRSGGLKVNVTLQWITDSVTTRLGDSDPHSRRAKVDQRFLNLLQLFQQHGGRMRHLQFKIPADVLPRLDFEPDSVQKFSLHLTHMMTSSTSLQIPSRLKHITCLRIDAELTVINALDLFRQCPLLVEWTSLVVRDRGSETTTIQTPVEPMHLSSFDVDIDDIWFSLFVGALTIPSIRRFAIKVNSRLHMTPSNLSPITEMIIRSTSDLSDFGLQYTGMLDKIQFTTLASFLHRLPRLHSLSLIFDADLDGEGWNPTTTLFEPFLVSKPGPRFLPCLRHLYYSTPRLQPWIPIAAFYKYHSTDTTVRTMSVADFSTCAQLLPRGVIDKESVQIFLTLPTTGLSFKFNPKLLAISIEHHGLPTPENDVMSYYTGLEKSLQRVRTFRRRVLWHLHPDTSLNDTLTGSDAEMDQEHVSDSAKGALFVYGH